MPILKVNDHVTFSINFKVVKAFVFEHDVYYLVIALKKDTLLNNLEGVVWGCLSVDGTHKMVPEGAFKKAAELIQKINLKDLE